MITSLRLATIAISVAGVVTLLLKVFGVSVPTFCAALALAVVGAAIVLLGTRDSTHRLGAAVSVAVYGFTIANVAVSVVYFLGVIWIWAIPQSRFPYLLLLGSPIASLVASLLLLRARSASPGNYAATLVAGTLFCSALALLLLH
jgi:hypothetical protein